MSSWSKRRRLTYAAVAVVIAVGAVAVPVFFVLYQAPTCSDGRMNGKEQGIDCGGSCVRLCQSAFLPPEAAWTRFEQVAPHLYNVAAYIINPNAEGEARRVPYKISLFDNRGTLILEYQDEVTIPPHRNTLAFRGAIDVKERIPAKAVFEFEAAPVWREIADPLGALQVLSKDYSEEGQSSSLSVILRNAAAVETDRMSVYAVLYDADGNALGFSKTIVDPVPARGQALAPFTWPKSRDGKVVSVEVLPVVE